MSTLNTIFSDLVIVEIATVLAGPAVGMFFAELGATVIKIENPDTGGDVTRSWKLGEEPSDKKYSAYYNCVNWHKDIRFLNAKVQEQYDEIAALIKDADVVISNFKTSSAASLHLDKETIKKINPNIIHATVTAYGECNDSPGYDALLQAETGWMSINGHADGPPTKMPVALIDILTAHQLKEGILVAMLKKAKTGKGSHVTVSLYDTAIASLANQASNYLNLNSVPARKGSQHPNIAPYGDIISSKDGIKILLAIGTDKQFAAACDILGEPVLAEDKRFLTNIERLANRTELIGILSSLIKTMNADDFLEGCRLKHVPAGRVRTIDQVFSDEAALKLILEQKEDDGNLSKRVRTMVAQVRDI